MRGVLGGRRFTALSIALALLTAVLGCFDSSAPVDDAAHLMLQVYVLNLGMQ